MVVSVFCALCLFSAPAGLAVLAASWGAMVLSLVQAKAQAILWLLYLEFLSLNVILILVFAFPASGATYPLLFTFFVLAVSEASFGLAMLVGYYRAHNSSLLKWPENLKDKKFLPFLSMPQMAPMAWIFLYLYFTSVFFVVKSWVYYLNV